MVGTSAPEVSLPGLHFEHLGVPLTKQLLVPVAEGSLSQGEQGEAGEGTWHERVPGPGSPRRWAQLPF